MDPIKKMLFAAMFSGWLRLLDGGDTETLRHLLLEAVEKFSEPEPTEPKTEEG